MNCEFFSDGLADRQAQLLEGAPTGKRVCQVLID